MTSDRVGLVIAALAAAVGATGCADLSRGSPTPDAIAPDSAQDGGAEAGPSSFAADVHGIVVEGCHDCHVAGGQADDTPFLLTGDVTADFEAVTAFVNTGAPSGSRILTKMTGQGHGGGTVYSADSPPYRAVLRWIQEGARP